MKPDERAFDALIACRHADPHSILGLHEEEGGFVVRAFAPGASGASVLPEGGAKRVPMERLRDEGLFEARFEGCGGRFRYELIVESVFGGDEVFADPYSFPPSLGPLDLHLFSEGRHLELHDKLGARRCVMDGREGVAFAVWAPNAVGVSVIGSWNYWDGRRHMMRSMGSSGIWEIFIPGIEPGALYKFEIRTRAGHLLHKADPFAKFSETPPLTASIVHRSEFEFGDAAWMEERRSRDPLSSPLSIYEVHLGSWKRGEGGRRLSYRELAHALADYLDETSFTHVEFLPVNEHPFDGSWGYQTTGYFAPTSRFGTPDDFKYLVDLLHRRGYGVILDWVPAHFPKDAFALGRFDGTAIFEHLDPREGEHPDWGTYIFNYGRKEVRNFLLSSALFLLDEYHIDGLRIDAVASMLYKDYSRKEGEWIPNRFGGRENLEAISFLKEMNKVVHGRFPGVMMLAEESTDWPGVSRPVYTGGLGFTFKWMMGWMHDTLSYFSRDPIHRKYHHNDLTFGLLYAWHENFVLPLSHDEVVHGKRSLISRMPGDDWRRFAGLRALYGWMWSHPGKKLLFMGGEFGQWSEWRHDGELDWGLLEWERHAGLSRLVTDLNRVYQAEPALWEADHSPDGFRWIDCSNALENILAFRRISPSTGDEIISIANLSPVVRHNYRIGLPRGGWYREIINTDAEIYGGSNAGNNGGVLAEEIPCHGLPFSSRFTLPPLAVLWFEVP